MAAKTKNKKSLLRRVRFRSEYIATLFLALLIKALPRQLSLKLGGALGCLGFWLMPERRRLADVNMRLALPEMSAVERRRALGKMFEHFGICGVEMLRLDRFRPGTGDLQRYFELDGMDYLREAYALGRGVLFLTGHVGFWEGGNFAIPEQGLPFDVVAKPMKNPLADRYITRLRETYGARVLDSKKGARRILKSLQQGRGVAILLDQHIRPPGSVPVDFFGRKAFTTTAITNMAMKYQVPVVPIFIYRLPGYRYRITAEPMMMLENGDDPQLILKNTQLLTDRIEAAIREDVSQWFWMHKRWRVPPAVSPGQKQD
ncbi:MAG: lysophospholipid acyltransferase family protein [Desulfuromonadales bacterium]|nr:lysophospholipid acyltransferase family protein [Desulfuromonadales bacterium]